VWGRVSLHFLASSLVDREPFNSGWIFFIVQRCQSLKMCRLHNVRMTEKGRIRRAEWTLILNRIETYLEYLRLNTVESSHSLEGQILMENSGHGVLPSAYELSPHRRDGSVGILGMIPRWCSTPKRSIPAKPKRTMKPMRLFH
jgi:hypothetical protein